jgi:ABC-type uncharacterized transport system substrate-binding protein
MTRGLLVAFLPLALLAAPLAAEAQPAAKVPRIGMLCAVTCSGEGTVRPPGAQSWRLLLVEALQEMGYVNGRNIEIVYRTSAQSELEPLRLLARELVSLEVNMIVVVGDMVAVQAAQDATRSVPIIVAVSGDPVGLGLVHSLAHPGGNITGMTSVREALAVKGFEFLRATVPGVSRVAVLLDPSDPVHARAFKALEGAVRSSGIDVLAINVAGPTNYQAQFATMTKDRIRALVVLSSPNHYLNGSRLAYLAVTNRIAAVSSFREFAEVGGLISYGPNWRDFYKRVASFVDRILRGARPSDLPFEEPTTFELVINLRTAKTLGLTIPPTVLVRADEIIQ